MELYAILDKDGSFVRAESTKQRADRARLNGMRVYPLAVQTTRDGVIGICDQGKLIVSPGKREWVPAGKEPSKGTPSKKVDSPSQAD